LTPSSRAQSLAISPVADRTIMSMKAATIASEIIATRSERSRRQASAQRPGETACGAS
jgi:hypothetical protein